MNERFRESAHLNRWVLFIWNKKGNPHEQIFKATPESAGVSSRSLLKMAKRLAQLEYLNSIIILPMSFMCGTLFDIDSLPSFVADIVWLLPLSHTSTIMRATATCTSFDPISIAVILTYVAVFYAICHIVIRKKLY